MPPAFADRRDAGRRLAQELAAVGVDGDAVVLGLPRGGVPVAAEVAALLGAPLDVLVVGKVGVPGHRELALAAVADDGTVALNPGVIASTGSTPEEVDALTRAQAATLVRRGADLRDGRAPSVVAGRAALVVDDGMATGATMRVALEVVRRRGARMVVAAVPVASVEAAASVEEAADRLVCLLTPEGFRAVGPWYGDFTQVGDAEVRALLRSAVQGVQDP